MNDAAWQSLLLAQQSGDVDSSFYLSFVVGVAIFAGIGAAIGSWKNRTGLGAVLGALLGFIGWIIIALMSKKRRY